MKYSWFPGHMKKTMETLSEEQKRASLIIILLDARCPLSSCNPPLEKIFENRSVIYIMNKDDLAEKTTSGDWLSYFKERNRFPLLFSTRTSQGKQQLIKILRQQKTLFDEKNADKYRSRIFRIIVAGLPNTGKSSLINILAGDKHAKVGKKPGVTRGKQWLKIEEDIEILDSPGVMPPRIETAQQGWHLALIGAVKLEILPVEEVVFPFLQYLAERNYLHRLGTAQNKGERVDRVVEEIKEDERESGILSHQNPYEKFLPVIETLGRERGFLEKGNRVNMEKTCLHIIKIFREGKLGRLSLESPPDKN